MNEEKILVSVCMCTRNRADIMLTAIKCILDQTYKNIELIIVDDASTDNTEEICNILAKQDSRIKYIRLEEHDFIRARNIAFANASGDYISLMDSDDLCAPDKIEQQVRFFEENPNIDLVGSRMMFGETTPNLSIPKTQFTWKHEYAKDQLEHINENISMLFLFASIMIRKSILDKVFPNKIYFYPELKNGGEDQIFLYILYMNGCRFGNCETSIYLYNYLTYEDSISASVGKHFDKNNFIFKYIHNKPLKEKLDVCNQLYTKYKNQCL